MEDPDGRLAAHRQLALKPLLGEAVNQPRARHQAAARRRDVQLGRPQRVQIHHATLGPLNVGGSPSACTIPGSQVGQHLAEPRPGLRACLHVGGRPWQLVAHHAILGKDTMT